MKDSKNKLDKSSSESKILETKTVPTMPKDKRTKAYKEWVKQYGGQEVTSDKSEKKPSKKDSKPKTKKSGLDKLVSDFIEKIESDDWFNKRKDIEELRSKINSTLKSSEVVKIWLLSCITTINVVLVSSVLYSETKASSVKVNVNPALLTFHVIIAVLTVLLYAGLFFSGRKILSGDNSKRK